ncbi:hypothetical protein AMTRI_Chr04g179890 [Amborella trichopoda]
MLSILFSRTYGIVCIGHAWYYMNRTHLMVFNLKREEGEINSVRPWPREAYSDCYFSIVRWDDRFSLAYEDCKIQVLVRLKILISVQHTSSWTNNTEVTSWIGLNNHSFCLVTHLSMNWTDPMHII